ncbi:uncharacterized protein RSE6_14059 [Rhynchosporium secalis]|uniref:Wax synthase domain-containing protein n=1 Tax=Rhynchosporium secalis TaxID=38038 RepID=A0A1E1MUE3_RHYSE|nr:uncharacterized protein RSE6_14059 [Rhynchosporium secalis]
MDSLLNAMYAFAAAHVLLHAALLTPTSVLSHTKLAVSFVPLIWSCHFYAWNFGFGYISAIHALWSAELLLFRDPRKDFGLLHFETKPPAPSPLPAAATLDAMKDGNRREMNVASVNLKDGNKDKSKVITHVSHTTGWTEPYPQSLWKRFVWVSKLVLSLRYNGWVTSDSQKALFTSQLPPPRRSRLIFIIQKLCVVGCCFVVLDAVHYYQHFDPYMQIETSIDEAFPRRLGGFFARHYLGFLSPRCVRIMVFGLEQYCNFTLLGTTPAVVFVALGGIGLVDDFWGSVENWPLIMGNPFAIARKGLRGFWGDFWHQLFRNLLTGPGKTLSKSLNLSPGSTISYVIQVVTAFGLSGMISSAGLPRDSKTINPIRCSSFVWIHGACVLCEIVLLRTAAMLDFNGSKSLWTSASLRVVNLIWTGLVLYHTVPLVQDEMTRVSRMYRLKPVYFITFPQ